MANSINTNSGALIALQSLNQTGRELGVTQNRINTGLKVGSAKDNGAVWAIAQGQRATSTALNTVKDSLQRGQSVVDVAMAAGETISDLLVQMKGKILAASEVGVSAASRKALFEDYSSLRGQITTAVDNAGFDGVNLLKATPNSVAALANAAGSSTIAVAGVDLSITSTDIAALNFTDFSTTAPVAADIAEFDTAIATVSTALSKFGTGSKALATHHTFVSKLQDSIDSGVGNLVDADLAKESARLQSLQTKQQLGVQALSIANQSSSILLSLFR